MNKLDAVAVKNAYDSYFFFNNERTLSTAVPSQLQIVDEESFTAYIDPTRRYDNQINIRATQKKSPLIGELLEYYSDDMPPKIRIDSDVAPSFCHTLPKYKYEVSYTQEFMFMTQADYMHRQLDGQVVVEVWEEDRADDFLNLLKTSGMNCEEQVWQAKRKYYCTQTFRCYVAFINNAPCAWATTFLDGNLATLANAYTQEQYRNQGCQTALLQARIVDAFESGIQYLLTDVLINTPSRRNCKSAGFSTINLCDVWEKQR